MSLRYLSNRFRFFVNDLLVRNPVWQILFLVVLSAAVILAGMALIKDQNPGDPWQSFWWSFTRLLDQGTFINDGGNLHTAFVGVFVTICGIMILSLLIGVLSSKITEQLDSLKKGRSPVAKKGHLIVCGNGDRLFEVTRELLQSRKDEPLLRRKSIVVLSECSREEMEDLLAQRTHRRSVPEVICRSGNVTDIDSLRIAGFDRCRGFVVTGEDDSTVLKTLIAVSSLCEGNDPVAVCEMRSREMGRIAEMAHDKVVWIPVREVVMRLLVQICRQPGLSTVYKEILSFQGNEFYLKNYPEAVGLTIEDIGMRLSGQIAVGIQREGRVILNPPLGTLFSPGDKLLVLAENRKDHGLGSRVGLMTEVKARPRQSCGPLFKMLIFVGYSTRFNLMLNLLDKYSQGGAEILVAGYLPEEQGVQMVKTLEYGNCSVSYSRMDRTSPDQVKALHPENFHSIMVVSGKKDEQTDEEADSECIVTLLILKEIRKSLGRAWNGTVVAEIRNPRNRRLASASEIDDFVISNEVCSMIMAQLVKQKELVQVFEELFDPAGCEIQLRCSSQYNSGSFREIEQQGRLRGEVILGWLTGTGSDAAVTLNPAKELHMPADESCRVIAIAER